MSLQRVLAESGLTKGEVAQIYGVTRQTIYRWADGLPSRKYALSERRMQEVITAALLTAVERRILPLASTDKEIRRRRIERMARMCQALKPEPRTV